MVGTPTKPTAVAVPVTNPTRESEGREAGAQKGRLCNSCADKLEKSNSKTMSCPLKVTTDNEAARKAKRMDLFMLTCTHRQL